MLWRCSFKSEKKGKILKDHPDKTHVLSDTLIFVLIFIMDNPNAGKDRCFTIPALPHLKEETVMLSV